MKNNNMIKIELTNEQTESLIEVIEYWMEELKEHSTIELPNTEEYYKFDNILYQLKKQTK